MFDALTGWIAENAAPAVVIALGAVVLTVVVLVAFVWGAPAVVRWFKTVADTRMLLRAERDWRANEARDRYYDGPDW